MGICRYWQQGTCTFGSSCRFEHSGPGGRNTGGNIFSGSSGAGGGAGNQQDITNTLVTTVKQDVEASQKGKQWLFSCYSPAKDCISIPGMDDISPEEMRVESYTAKTNGTQTQYQQKYQELIQTYNRKRQALANPTNELKEVFRKIYNKENLANIPPNILEQQQAGASGGLFGGGGGQASVFGSNNSSSNPFGAKQSTGGSIFGGGGQSSTPGGNSNNLFQQKSTFGASAAGGASVFGGNQSSTNTSGGIFGGNSSTN